MIVFVDGRRVIKRRRSICVGRVVHENQWWIIKDIVAPPMASYEEG